MFKVEYSGFNFPIMAKSFNNITRCVPAARSEHDPLVLGRTQFNDVFLLSLAIAISQPVICPLQLGVKNEGHVNITRVITFQLSQTTTTIRWASSIMD